MSTKGVSSKRGGIYSKIQAYIEQICKHNFTVLEAGCGSGLISLELARKRNLKRLVLLDIHEDILEKARNNFNKFKINAEFMLGDVQNLPFRNESFDLVFNEGVIEHLDDMERGVKEMARVSKKYVICLIPNYYNILWRIEKRWKRWQGKFYYGADEYGLEKDITHKDVMKWLNNCNFEVKLLELGGLRKDKIFPTELKAWIGILGVRR